MTGEGYVPDEVSKETPKRKLGRPKGAKTGTGLPGKKGGKNLDRRTDRTNRADVFKKTIAKKTKKDDRTEEEIIEDKKRFFLTREKSIAIAQAAVQVKSEKNRELAYKAYSFMASELIPLKDACVMAGIPYSIISHVTCHDPELKAFSRTQREQYLIGRVDQLQEIAMTTPDVHRARLLCDNIKWEIARMIPSQYGDRVTLTGDSENPVILQHKISAEELERKIRGEVIDVTPLKLVK